MFAVAAAKYMDSVIFGLSVEHMTVLTPVAGLLVAVSLAAAWVPARRAAVADPLRALAS